MRLAFRRFFDLIRCISPLLIVSIRLQACGYYPRIGRLVPVPAFDTKARTSMLTREGDRVRVHPASINSKLRIEKPEVDKDDDSEPPPEVAALMFYDEVTRGDSFLCESLSTTFIVAPMTPGPCLPFSTLQ